MHISFSGYISKIAHNGWYIGRYWGNNVHIKIFIFRMSILAQWVKPPTHHIAVLDKVLVTLCFPFSLLLKHSGRKYLKTRLLGFLPQGTSKHNSWLLVLTFLSLDAVAIQVESMTTYLSLSLSLPPPSFNLLNKYINIYLLKIFNFAHF